MDTKQSSGRIFAVGETVLDILFRDNQPQSATAGGSMLNTAVSLGRMGMNVCFISEFGADNVGDMVNDMLKREGVNTDSVYRFDGQSSLALAFLDESGNASYEFYKRYPEKRLDVELPELTTSDIVLFGSFYGIDPVIHQKIRPWLLEGRRCGATIIYDPNYRASHLPDLAIQLPVIIENIRLADIVKGSVDDFAYIFGTANAHEAWERLNPLCSTFICTADKREVHLFQPSLHETYAVPSIRPVSTIGAGDNFNAGLIAALHHLNINAAEILRWDAAQRQTVIDTAMRCAQEVCMREDNYVSREFAESLRFF